MNARIATAKPSLAVVDGKTAPLSEILEILDRDGGVIVHNMLTPEVVARMLEELQSTTTTTQIGPKTSHEFVNYFWGEKTKRFTRLAQRSQTFADEVLVHPILLGLADANAFGANHHYAFAERRRFWGNKLLT